MDLVEKYDHGKVEELRRFYQMTAFSEIGDEVGLDIIQALY